MLHLVSIYATMEKCSACGQEVGNVKNRRNLCSEASRHAIPILREILGQDFAEGPVKGYLCRSCFREIEKIIKLRKDTDVLMQQLHDKAVRSSLLVSVEREKTGEKRASRAAESSAAKRRKVCSSTSVEMSNSQTKSPQIVVTVIGEKRPQNYVMTPKRKRICKPLMRGSLYSLARKCIDDANVKKYIIKCICTILQSEIAKLCSNKSPSVLKEKTNIALETFCWSKLITEMEASAPTLLSILTGCTKTSAGDSESIIGAICAMLCKHRNPTASIFQRLMSIILYSGHASKVTFKRMQKLCLCVSHWKTIQMMDKLGEGFDSQVMKWKADVQNGKTFCAHNDPNHGGNAPEAHEGSDNETEGMYNSDLSCPFSFSPLSTASPGDGGMHGSDLSYPFTSSPRSTPASPAVSGDGSMHGSGPSCLASFLSTPASPEGSVDGGSGLSYPFASSPLSTSASPAGSVDGCYTSPLQIPTSLSMISTDQDEEMSTSDVINDTGSLSSNRDPEEVNLSNISIPASDHDELIQSHGGITRPPPSIELPAPSNISLPAANDEPTRVSVAESNLSPPSALPASSPSYGYKFVIDNIDKNVTPRNMTMESQTRSLHYVQIYSVKHKIDYPSLFNQAPSPGFKNLYDILPGPEDYTAIKKNFTILAARLIVEHLPFFSSDFKGLIPRHTPHQFSTEMQAKSEVIPLGILPKNENKYDDMLDILDHVQQYVPSKQVPTKVVHTDGEIETINDMQFHTSIIGGDQLTAARIRGARLIRSDTATSQLRIDGLLPTAEDWHAKICFMEVMWKRLYSTSSSMDRGTLFQLRNLISRRNVPVSCKKNTNACEEFLSLTVTGHILTAAMKVLGMSSIDDVPSKIVPSGAWWMDDSERKSMVMKVASSIVNEHVDLATDFKAAKKKGRKKKNKDGVYSYACELLSLGLIYLEFCDAVKEGDGDRLLRVWKYLLVIFKATNRKNYANEALLLLSQYHITLPPQLAATLKWDRFVNASGRAGHNISCDLHLEHLNRTAKTAIEGLGANKSEKAIVRVGKSMNSLVKVLKQFDTVHHVAEESGSHTRKPFFKDLQTVVKQLTDAKVFEPQRRRREHRSFPKLSGNIISTLDEKKLKNWMVYRFSYLL